VEQRAAADLQPFQRADLLIPHEAAVTNYISGQDRGKPSLHICALRDPRWLRHFFGQVAPWNAIPES
ncbi:hypothetical protein ACCT09_39575, partial [Rhizobium ruizarguesonis]